jgi:hypothetical protein
MKMTNKSNNPEVRSPFRGTKIMERCKIWCIWIMAVVATLFNKVRNGAALVYNKVKDLAWPISLIKETALPIFLVIILMLICCAERPKQNTYQPNVISHNIVSVDESMKDAVGKTTDESVDETVRVQQEETTTIKSNEEIASEIIKGLWGNGEERINRLVDAGYNPSEIQAIIDNLLPKTQTITNTVAQKSIGGTLTKRGGVCYNNPYGMRETWYSQRVLPGGGLNIPGRHIDGRGFVCDGDGYICVAVDNRVMPKGTLVQTSNGMAKVYDNCPTPNTIDVYVNW